VVGAHGQVNEGVAKLYCELILGACALIRFNVRSFPAPQSSELAEERVGCV